MLYLVENNTNKILVENGCDLKDLKKFAQILQEPKKVEISFIATSTILPEVIKLLVLHAHKIKITTDSKVLWLYLRQLSIDISNEGLLHKVSIENTQVKAIAIGGSAGALSNIMKIVEELPYSDIAIFIVVHILPNKNNKLVDIISKTTKYKVKEPIDGEKVEPNCIYIASPDLHMRVENNHIYSFNAPSVNYCRPSIDVLFKSLAKEYKSSLLAILTCGYLSDGASSLIDIKENNGLIIIQNPQECEADEIPLNGIYTKNYTHIFHLKEINEYIKLKLNAVVDIEQRIKSFVDEIYRIYNHDFRDYDMKLLKRRVDLLRLELGLATIIELENLVLKDKEVFDLLFKKLSINVSEFFRNPEVFEQIREDVLPTLETYPHIRVWCSACSQGQEAYSVAMLLDEAGLLDKSIIYATDFNEVVLKEAQNALYSANQYKLYEENYIKSGGKREFSRWFEINDNYIEVAPYIKKKVHFFQHNLVMDSEINEFQLVFCRNVLIYFEKKLQKKVFQLLNNSLMRKGFLVLGKSEMVYTDDGFRQLNISSKNKIFKKI